MAEKQRKLGFMNLYKYYTSSKTKRESVVVTNKPKTSSLQIQENGGGGGGGGGGGNSSSGGVAGGEERRGNVVDQVVVVVPAGRKSVSSVETTSNLVSVAAFLQVKVLVSDMPGFMPVHAFRCARATYDCLDKFSSKHMAFNIKKEFDKVYGPAWHCIVGSSFGSFVTHSTGCFLYFSMDNLYILVFKTKVQKALHKD